MQPIIVFLIPEKSSREHLSLLDVRWQQRLFFVLRWIVISVYVANVSVHYLEPIFPSGNAPIRPSFPLIQLFVWLALKPTYEGGIFGYKGAVVLQLKDTSKMKIALLQKCKCTFVK